MDDCHPIVIGVACHGANGCMRDWGIEKSQNVVRYSFYEIRGSSAHEFCSGVNKNH